MGIATPWGMSHDHLSVVQTDLDARRPLELFVLDHVKIQAWDRILFVQCGDGWIVEEAWRRAVRAYVCGLDTSGADVALAKQLREVAGKVEFATWDGRSLPVSAGAFDRVIAFLAAPPSPPATLVCDLRRVLRRDGDLYLLHSASTGLEVRQAFARAGWSGVRDVARSEDQTAVLVHARGGEAEQARSA